MYQISNDKLIKENYWIQLVSNVRSATAPFIFSYLYLSPVYM